VHLKMKRSYSPALAIGIGAVAGLRALARKKRSILR
jgi:hypothetical protein